MIFRRKKRNPQRLLDKSRKKYWVVGKIWLFEYNGKGNLRNSS